MDCGTWPCNAHLGQVELSSTSLPRSLAASPPEFSRERPDCSILSRDAFALKLILKFAALPLLERTVLPFGELTPMNNGAETTPGFHGRIESL